MEVGITGLPAAGKTTLFNALTGQHAVTGAYSSSEAHRAAVRVPDERLDHLRDMFEPKKFTPAQVHYVDVAGIAKGGKDASRASLLASLRTVDALIHVVGAYQDEAAVSEGGPGIDPASDIADLNLELTMADLEVVERRVERLGREVKSGKTEGEHELAVLERCVSALNDDTPLRVLEFTDEEARLIKGYQFLTLKPTIIVVNVDEGRAGEADRVVEELASHADIPHTELLALSADIEMEISDLDAEDRPAFLADLGIEEPAVDRLVRVSHDLLDLISFFTVGSDEVRAWTLVRGETALDAAGTIHTDLARGFIRAETVAYDDLAEAGTMAAAKEKSVVRLEGKAYTVKDGDVINIRFNI